MSVLASLSCTGVVCVGVGLAGVGSARADRPRYPATRTVDVVDELHGMKVPDPYRWLEKSDDPEVQAWTEQQNALTRHLLDRFVEQRADLAQRLEELYKPSISSPPARYGTRYFFLKREGLQNHAVLYVREGGLDAKPKVVIDPNTFSADGNVALDWSFPSPDGSLIVYGKSAAGSEKSTLYLRDVATAADLALVIPDTRHAAVAWDPDSHGLTYTRYPAAGTVPAGDENYYRRVYYHKFGTKWEDDAVVWGEGRPKEEWTGVSNSSDDKYQFLSVSLDWSKNDLYMRKAGEKEFRPVAVGLDGLFNADVLGDKLFIHTNYKAPRYRIAVTSVDKPTPENWQDVVPEHGGVQQALALAGGKLVVQVLENACSRLLVYEPDGKLNKEITLPALGSASGLSGRPDHNELFFSFQSFAYPAVVFQYDVSDQSLKEIDRLAVKVALDQYETKQVWFNSKDGTRVPMFVTCKKGLQLDGHNPAVLMGYGGFDISETPTFYRAGIPWLEAGGVWAVANIRGGGEFGKEWHLAGRLEKKQNCFDDFSAAAEKLIADGYTRAERLGGLGGSNGGLLMGAMLVQRPDLFRAIACEVPLLDMLRYQNFSIARLWIPEYGSAENPEQFKFLYAYSPYHHVKKDVAYPAVLFTTADHDTRADPMHARKMAAAVQAASSSDRPALLWVETKAGQGAGKPLSKYIEDEVDAWTFFMWQLGVFDQKS